jgi:hypothetical protein
MSKPFRIWDSITLEQGVHLALQFRSKIEELCNANQCLPRDLPDSLISSEQLYVLVLSYEAAYSKLLDAELLKTGNLRGENSNLH